MNGEGINNFPILKNDLILKVFRREKVNRIPIWIMRQAGRYLPEIRARHSFFDICQNPELIAEVTLMPINRYKLDAAIIFSDILVILQSIGLEVKMEESKGPVIVNYLQTPEDLNRLNWCNSSDSTVNGHSSGDLINLSQKVLTPVYEGITLTRHKLEGKVPLIGFAGAPWTLMTYAIEGGSGSAQKIRARTWLYKYPEESEFLLRNLSVCIAQHLIKQAQAGVQILQIFESHGDCLNKHLFQRFCTPYLKLIAEHIKRTLGPDNCPPLILFAKGVSHSMAQLGNLGFDAISLDWTVDPIEARKIFGNEAILQGNLDPCALFGTKEALQNLACDMISKFNGKNYIANLGHGIYPETPINSVDLLIEAIHSFPLL